MRIPLSLVLLLAAAPAALAQKAPADCTALGTSIAPAAIALPVRSVTISPMWVEAADGVPAYCRVDGVMAPVDTAPSARPINFRVLLPAAWNERAAQLGGGGMNGIIPNL